MVELPSDLRLTGSLRFAVRCDPRAGESIDWLADRGPAKALVEAILSVPLLADGLKVGRADDGAWADITAADVGQLVAANRDVVVELEDRVDGANDAFVQLNLSEGFVDVWIDLAAGRLAGHVATALDELTAVAVRAHAALAPVAGLQQGYVRVDFAQRELEYARSRPPRESDAYPPRSILTFIDPAFHASVHPLANTDAVERLLRSPPPPPATVTTVEQLVVVRWCANLKVEALVTAASGHEAWVSERLRPDLADGFNELGDQRDNPGSAKPAPPLTLYAPRWRIGYKAVLVLPDGTIEPTAWNEAKQVLDAHALPDGTAVEWVRLVVPLREHVFKVAAQAKEAGFDAVLYPDEEGVFWNPDPAGLWRTAPLGS
ncbi:MAG: hypothetical protein R3B72_27415 [Polyangiaceae bacterium]